ncbi:MAG: hypothetical protein OEW91_17005, partial [Acidimicrobiia bacterium]|nr:hypothetical protein [Acidimicrobiia bacterium]
TSNGAGMGHLTRQLAVGLAMPDGVEASILTMSVGAATAAGRGIAIEYCPSYERGWMPRRSWNTYLRDRIVALVDELGADVVAFDGVAPYPGIAFARAARPKVGFVWLRRGMWRPDASAEQLRRSSVFDLIIEPGDLAQDADRGITAARTDAVRVPPISMVDVIGRLPRGEAAVALGLDPDRPTLLLTLGSGRLGDVQGPADVVLDAISASGWQVAVTRAAIATKDIVHDDSVVPVRGVYPLVRYVSAFDAVVSAAGYNAVHEFLPAGIPTLLVPNGATRTDDQVGRARYLASRGLALVAPEDDREVLAEQARLLLEEEKRAQLEATTASVSTGGAAATGELLAELAQTFGPSLRRVVASRIRVLDEQWRAWAKRALGPENTGRLQRALGRPVYDGPDTTLTVDVVRSEREFLDRSGNQVLLMATDPGTTAIQAGGPVEGVLAGTSPEYLAARTRIVETYYNVARISPIGGSSPPPGPV